MTKARYFYAFGRGTMNLSTKDRLFRLADDYLKQAYELRHAEAFAASPNSGTNFRQAGNDPPDIV